MATRVPQTLFRDTDAVSCSTMDTYRVVHWGAAVGVGVSNSSYVHLEAIGKANSALFPYCVANELVSAEIGRRLRLPVPPCCVAIDSGGQPRFLSLNFNLTGNALPPVIPANFAATFANDLADILIFDIFIGNPDRHTANLAADYGLQPRYTLFDHSHVLLGGSGITGIPRLKAMQNSLVVDGKPPGVGGQHCLIKEIKDDRAFRKMIERVESLEEYFLRDVVDSMADYGLRPDEVDELADFLLHRRSMVRQMIAGEKAAFPGITQWSLL